MKTMSADEMFKAMQQRKNKCIAAAETSIKDWDKAIREAEAEMNKTSQAPHMLEKYILANEKATAAAQQKAEAESLLNDLVQHKRFVVTDDETAAYKKAVITETCEKLLDNCSKQIELYKQLDELRKQAVNIEQVQHTAIANWYNEFSDGILPFETTMEEITSHNLKGPYGSLAAVYSALYPMDMLPEITGLRNTGAAIRDKLRMIEEKGSVSYF